MTEDKSKKVVLYCTLIKFTVKQGLWQAFSLPLGCHGTDRPVRKKHVDPEKRLRQQSVSDLMVIKSGSGHRRKTAGIEKQLPAELESGNYRTRQEIAA